MRLSDKIAYINHDIDDAIRGGILSEADIPPKYRKILGTTTRSKIKYDDTRCIIHSMDQPKIQMSEEVEAALMGLRKFMFENVYRNPLAKSEGGKSKSIGTESL